MYCMSLPHCCVSFWILEQFWILEKFVLTGPVLTFNVNIDIHNGICALHRIFNSSHFCLFKPFHKPCCFKAALQKYHALSFKAYKAQAN